MAETKRVTCDAAGPWFGCLQFRCAAQDRAAPAFLNIAVSVALGLAAASVPATAGDDPALPPPPAVAPDMPPGIRIAPELPPQGAEAPASPPGRAAPRLDDSERTPRIDEGCPYRGRQLELIV